MSLGRFITPLDLQEYAPNGRPQANLWVVTQPLIYKTFGEVITVPRGFVTDLASIPRSLRAVFNVNGLSRAPAVLHDYLYCSQLHSRDVADDLFLDALESRGVSQIQRYTLWLGVRAGGWLYFERRKKGLGLTLEDFVPPDYFNAAGVP